MLGTGDEPAWTPLPGPQTQALECEADELLYGGAAGGGKSYLLLGLALTRHRRSVIFRREHTQLSDMLDRVTDIGGSRGKLVRSPNPVWRGTDGRVVEFAGLQHEDDTRKWRGRAHDLKAFDELSEFSEQQYLWISAWARTTDASQRVRVVATTNPPSDEQGAWIIRRWAPWLDAAHADPAAPGVLRWFATVDGVEQECEDGEPFNWKGETIRPRSRTFIPARLVDNPYLDSTGYAAVLQSMPEPLRSQLLYGDFSVGLTSHPYQVIPSEWVRAAQARWTPERPEVPGTDRPVAQSCVSADVAQGGNDRTVLACRYGDWVDRLIVKPGRETPTAEHVARLVEAELVRGGYAVVDCDGVGGEAYGVLLSRHTAKARAYRGVKPTFWRDKAGVLEFFNTRAAAYWAMREALDPKNGRPVALPPDADLRAELCSARWEWRGQKVKLEDKDDIVSRLGRSPDLADAVVMAFWPGAAAELAESYGVKVGTD